MTHDTHLRRLSIGLSHVTDLLERQDPALPPARLALLHRIATHIAAQRREGRDVHLVFICTHNSRRSHMSQLWAQAAAWRFGIDGVFTWSGGTEATAFNTHAVEAMRGCGFDVTLAQPGANPVYEVRFAREAPLLAAWSKRYDEAPNPSAGFTAIMTCSEADAACPIVTGAAARFSLPYRDPKESDGTGRETEVYRDRCLDIGAEMMYLMKLTAQNLFS